MASGGNGLTERAIISYRSLYQQMFLATEHTARVSVELNTNERKLTCLVLGSNQCVISVPAARMMGSHSGF